jgi:AraC-like DNA-binding protein
MDPLSDVLSLLKLRNYMCGGFDMGGDWSIRFPPPQGIKCYALVSGHCWLSVDGVPEPVRLSSGDCFILPLGRAFVLASDLSLPPADAYALFNLPLQGAIRCINGGGGCFGVGGGFELAGPHADILLQSLPPIVHIRSASDKATMRLSLERLMQELRHPQPGGALIAQHLVTMMLIHALRLHFAEGLGSGVGWLFALADPQMSAAIHAIHAEPARRWTLQELAASACMSRSTFALRFKQTVGKSPMEYLTHWRMVLAGDRMAHSRDPISTIAFSLGYDSESAFSTAFKRIMGSSPRQYSRTRSAVHPPATPETTHVEELELIAA